MPQPPKTLLAITCCLIGGCVVYLPGNLDAGDGTDDMSEMPGDGDDEMMPGDGDGDGDDDMMTGDGDGDPYPLDGDGCQAAVDVLVVVDNSGSMGGLQRRLAESIDSLITPLENDGIDWRLAITTTDVGNPWCQSESTTPAMGAFQLRSCKDHIDDFVFGGDVDVQDVACNDICPHPAGKLVTTPTTTAVDPTPAPRPWLQGLGGVNNLPEDIDSVSASQCLLPQGVNGCGFEQPLEAMALALELATTPGKPEYGFLRDDASLLVVFVTDEADCSHADESIFDLDGERAFWSSPDESFPSSAVCWNAGVLCLGDGPVYTDCVPANYGPDGGQTMPGDAVLHPVNRYINLLRDLEQDKRVLDPGADVAVMVIAGLGTDDEFHFADVSMSDPEFQQVFGIGPGCTGAVDPLVGHAPTAVPPVRLRELGTAMSSVSAASICNPDYDQPFAYLQDQLVGECM